MNDKIALQVAQRGLITLPKALREAYDIQDGDLLTLLDLGGVFVLSPQRVTIDGLADELKAALSQQGECLESMLQALREAREKYAP